MLRTRVILGALLVAGLLCLFLLDGYLDRRFGIAWAPAFFAVVSLVAVAGVHEMGQLLGRRGWRIHEAAAQAAVIALMGAAAASRAGIVDPAWQAGPLAVGPGFLVLTLLTLAVLVLEVLRTWTSDGIDGAVQRVGGTLLAVAYVALPLLFVVGIRFLAEPDGLMCLLVVLAATKCTDIGGYVAGRLFGRHKFAPRLSPNKTVEGCLGGLALGLAASLALGYPLLSLGRWPLVLFGLVVAACAMLGDLAESLIKRGSEAKDSSNAVPGFGGVLDIIDSVLFAAPAAYGLLVLLGARH